MELTEIAAKIENKIQQLEILRKQLKGLAEKSGQTIGDYYKKRGRVIIQLRNGVEFTLDGETIKNPSISNSEIIAQGICWKEKLEETKSREVYRAALAAMESLKAELNGYQSINRYLSEN